MKAKVEYDENGNLLEGVVETKLTKSWYVNGLLHRERGPARINYNGNRKVESIYWYKNGLINRFKKPAVIYRSGYKAWYKQGILVKIEENGYTEHHNLLGQIHRIGGPAIIKKNGDKEWYQYGKLHRDDGPAIELSNGHKAWFTNGVIEEESGTNFTKCSFTKKIDIDTISKTFNRDLDELICEYDSNPSLKLLSSFAKSMKKMFNDFILCRDNLLTYKQEVTLVDCASIINPDCCEEERKKANGSD